MAPVPEAAAAVFKIVEELVTGEEKRKGGVTADNYEHVVVLLNDFATAGSVGAQDEQRREVGSRDGKGRGKPEEKTKTKKRKNKTDEAVNRGVKAVSLVYSLVGKVRAWIELSHLERSKGTILSSFDNAADLQQHGRLTGPPSSTLSQLNPSTRAASFAQQRSLPFNAVSSLRLSRPYL